MNYKLVNVLAFAAGAAVGSVVTWKLIKTKYEQIAQEEIDSVKETFSRRFKEESEEYESKPYVKSGEQASSVVPDKPDLMEYALKIAKEHGYVPENELEDNKEEEDNMAPEPYVVSPDEFGETDYEMISLTLYADGVLADDMDEVIEDPDSVVGSDIESHFGEYEDDTVFVRNDEQEIDYEICRDERNFSDVHVQ